jgi:hypothetical protein
MKDIITLNKYKSTLDFILEANDYQIIVNDDDSSQIYFYRVSNGIEYILKENDINDFYSDRKKYENRQKETKTNSRAFYT